MHHGPGAENAVRRAVRRAADGKTLDLAYWQNAIGALALIPAILVAREEETLMAMIAGTTGDLSGFIKGSAITVSLASILSRCIVCGKGEQAEWAC